MIYQIIKLQAVHSVGQFMVSCDCRPDCDKVGITLDEFESHSGRRGRKNWSKNIWVEIGLRSLPLKETVLYKIYQHSANTSNCNRIAERQRRSHPDEFMQCSQCNKTRRFRLRTRAECGIYHRATLNSSGWKCSDLPYDTITFDDKEERQCRRVSRGCPHEPFCKGCTACVCFRLFHLPIH